MGRLALDNRERPHRRAGQTWVDGACGRVADGATLSTFQVAQSPGCAPSDNARASVAPDGRKIAVAQGRGNEYRIAVWDIESERFMILTPGRLDESPSFAPNGSMILYATREGDRGVLSAVSADGNVRQRLILSEGDVREPAWSPVIR